MDSVLEEERARSGSVESQSETTVLLVNNRRGTGGYGSDGEVTVGESA